ASSGNSSISSARKSTKQMNCVVVMRCGRNSERHKSLGEEPVRQQLQRDDDHQAENDKECDLSRTHVDAASALRTVSFRLGRTGEDRQKARTPAPPAA